MSTVILSVLLVMACGWANSAPEIEWGRLGIHFKSLLFNRWPETSRDVRDYFAKMADSMGNLPVKQPSQATGVKVAQYDPNTSKMNPEELGDLYQGDIMIPQKTRTGVINPSQRWSKGYIPYTFASSVSSSTKSKILSMFKQYESQISCMKFISRTKEKDYIQIQSTNTGCWSYVGRRGGMQEVNYQDPGCTSDGTIIHELMHAAGFFHEQSREDRDSYVDIIYANIIPGTSYNFDKVPAGTTTVFGVPYTYNSVMHYSAYAFSVNGQKTIVAKPNPNVAMGQRNGFDPNDVAKLRKMYGC